jgi:CBS domain-containing protein
MSPRAACRLERFGFGQVYDYVAGIADWKAAGLPVDGDAPSVQQVADATRSDVPTCLLEETMAEARTRTFAGGWEECVVIDCDGTVVGRLRDGAWKEDDSAMVGDVMESGPTTVRPDGVLQQLVDRMAKRETKMVLVTTPQGTLVGALLRVEAERLLAGEPPEQVWRDCDGCPGRWVTKKQLA